MRADAPIRPSKGPGVKHVCENKHKQKGNKQVILAVAVVVGVE